MFSDLEIIKLSFLIGNFGEKGDNGDNGLEH
jgi:hypothetical protein